MKVLLVLSLLVSLCVGSVVPNAQVVQEFVEVDNQAEVDDFITEEPVTDLAEYLANMVEEEIPTVGLLDLWDESEEDELDVEADDLFEDEGLEGIDDMEEEDDLMQSNEKVTWGRRRRRWEWRRRWNPVRTFRAVTTFVTRTVPAVAVRTARAVSRFADRSFRYVSRGVVATANKFASGVQGAANAALNEIQKVGTFIAKTAQAAWDAAKKFATDIIKKLTCFKKGPYNCLPQSVKNTISSAINTVKKLGSAVWNTYKTATTAIKNFFNDVKKAATSLKCSSKKTVLKYPTKLALNGWKLDFGWKSLQMCVSFSAIWKPAAEQIKILTDMAKGVAEKVIPNRFLKGQCYGDFGIPLLIGVSGGGSVKHVSFELAGSVGIAIGCENKAFKFKPLWAVGGSVGLTTESAGVSGPTLVFTTGYYLKWGNIPGIAITAGMGGDVPYKGVNIGGGITAAISLPTIRIKTKDIKVLGKTIVPNCPYGATFSWPSPYLGTEAAVTISAKGTPSFGAAIGIAYASYM